MAYRQQQLNNYATAMDTTPAQGQEFFCVLSAAAIIIATSLYAPLAVVLVGGRSPY